MSEFNVEALREQAKNMKKTREEQHKTRLVQAHANAVNAIYNATVDAIHGAILARPDDASYAIVRDPLATADLCGFHHLRILCGKYNRENGTYSRDEHIAAGITSTPIEDAFAALKPGGVTSLTDISDPTRSHRIFYKVTFEN